MSSAEAARLLVEFGPNEIPEERRSLLLEIGSRFWGPIPWMIEAAVVLTAVVRRWADFAIIAVLLLVNGAVGFWEEHQAGSAIEARLFLAFPPDVRCVVYTTNTIEALHRQIRKTITTRGHFPTEEPPAS